MHYADDNDGGGGGGNHHRSQRQTNHHHALPLPSFGVQRANPICLRQRIPPSTVGALMRGLHTSTVC